MSDIPDHVCTPRRTGSNVPPVNTCWLGPADTFTAAYRTANGAGALTQAVGAHIGAQAGHSAAVDISCAAFAARCVYMCVIPFRKTDRRPSEQQQVHGHLRDSLEPAIGQRGQHTWRYRHVGVPDSSPPPPAPLLSSRGAGSLSDAHLDPPPLIGHSTSRLVVLSPPSPPPPTQPLHGAGPRLQVPRGRATPRQPVELLPHQPGRRVVSSGCCSVQPYCHV
jgi:hypothetical protein